MSSKEKTKILENRIDFMLEDILLEEQAKEILLERGAGYQSTRTYKFFVEPFKDVFAASRLSLMSFGNSFLLVAESLLAHMFRSKKLMIEARINFNERKQEINREWSPILQRAQEAFGGTDPILKFALMGPQAFFLMQGIQVGATVGKTAVETLTGTGWDKLFNNFRTNLSAQETLRALEAREDKRENERQNLAHDMVDALARLEKLFLGTAVSVQPSDQSDQSKNTSESSNKSGFVISEQDKQEKKADQQAQNIPDDALTEKRLKAMFNELGLTTKMERTVINKLRDIENLIEKSQPILKTIENLSLLFSSENIEEYIQNAKKINEKGGDIDVSKIEEMRKGIEKGASEMVKKSQESKDKKQITLDQAKVIVFSGSVTNINNKILNTLKDGDVGLPSFKKSLKEMGIDEKTKSLLSKSSMPEAKKILKIYKEFEETYKNAEAEASKPFKMTSEQQKQSQQGQQEIQGQKQQQSQKDQKSTEKSQQNKGPENKKV